MVARWILSACLMCGLVAAAMAAVTPDQKKEIVEVNKSMSVVAGHIRKKEYDAAEEVLKNVETRIAEIAEAAGVETKDKAFSTVNKTLAGHRRSLDKAQGKTPARNKNQGVSFTREVAPLINEKCVSCHGPSMQSGGLRLDTFANWVKGGRNGQLLTPGSPQQSLILFRMATPDMNLRMPKNAAAIEKENLAVVANWITQGAAFDGADQETPLASLRTAEEVKEQESKIKIVKPKGTEKVSFTKDIAPFMANLCVGCHSGNAPRGGLSLETFYDMMKGGESGIVVLPGEPKEKSRLFRLTGGLENPRMPNGDQIRLTRKNYENLVTWFEEGCVYDGVDPKTPIRSFVKSAAEMAQEKTAKLSPAEFNTLRQERSGDQMKKALPNDTAVTLESDDLLLVGNADETRMKQVEEWAKEHVAALRKGFSAPSGQVWKGRLAVFVMKDRFSYEEFSQTVTSRRPPEGMHGHIVISPSLEDALIVLEDVGDEVSVTSPGLRVNLIEYLTGAYLKRTGANLPEWLLQGTGLSMAVKIAGRNAYLDALPKEAATIVPTLGSPQEVFEDASFSPTTVGAVGMTLVEYLLLNGGQGKFSELIRSLESGSTMNEAVSKCYGVDSAILGGSFRDALKGK